MYKKLCVVQYSGDAKGIVERSNAAFKKFGRKVWLTEFAMTTHPPGSPVGRSRQDSFMREALPLFDATDSIFRYAWFSARTLSGTEPGSVNASNLLPVLQTSATNWTMHWSTSCSAGAGALLLLSGHVSSDECKARAMANSSCGSPVTAVYGSDCCWCAKSPLHCNATRTPGANLYVHNGPPPALWAKTAGTACAPSQMMRLGNGTRDVRVCQAEALSTRECVHGPTTTVVYGGGQAPCSCLNATTCTKTASAGRDLYVQPVPAQLPTTPTSTGLIYSGAS